MLGNNDRDDEPFGTTPLPTSVSSGAAVGPSAVEVTLNLHQQPSTSAGNNYQQPQTTQLAVYESTPNEECLNGSLVDVNQHFVVYAVKNGLIRVLHRHSTMRALLRGHAGQVVTDIRFFMDGDVLGTVGSGGKSSNSSSLIIWRVYENSPSISHEKLLEIHTPESSPLLMTRLVWHPFNPNQFWMLYDNNNNGASGSTSSSATLVETTRIQTRLGEEGNAICIWHSPTCIMGGALQLKETANASTSDDKLTDLAWSGRDARHVLSCNSNGRIVLWDLRQKASPSADASSDDEDGAGESDDVTVPKKLCVVEEVGVEWSRVCFLPHEAPAISTTSGSLTSCFVSASHQNSILTLWSGFTTTATSTTAAPLATPSVDPPVKLQVIKLASSIPQSVSNNPFSFVIDVCYGPAPSNAAPPSTFLLVGPRQPPPSDGSSSSPMLLAFHVRSQWNDTKTKALLVGTDYVVPFSIKHPIYSWSVVCAPTQDIADTENEAIGSLPGSSSSLIVNENGDTVAASDGFAASSLSFDIKLFSYQSKAVQTLTLTPYMLLPPEHAFPQDYQQRGLPPGILGVEALTGKYSTAKTNRVINEHDTAAAIVTSFDEEEYDVEDDDDEEEDDQADEPPPLPTANSSAGLGAGAGAGAGGMAGNPFANWLGAIATTGNPPKADRDALPAPPPPPPSTPATGILPEKQITEVDVLPPLPPGLGGQSAAAAASSATVASLGPTPEASNGASYLNPMDFLKSIGAGSGETNDDTNTKSQSNPQAPGKGSKGKGRGKSPKRSKSPKNKKQQQVSGSAKAPFPDGKVTILKREDNSGPESLPPIPADPSVLSDPAILAAAGIPIGNIPLPPVPPASSVTANIDPGMLEASVNKAVEKALAKTIVPAVNKSVQESFAALARPLRSSMDNLSKQGVSVDANDLRAAIDIETPLKAALAENMRHVIVPSLESISSQVLQQVHASMPSPPPDNTKALEMLTQQLGTMSKQMEVLTNEVQVLRKQVSEQAGRSQSAPPSHPGAGGPAMPPPPPPDPMAMQLEQIRQEILQLFSAGNYEAGFTKAVSITQTDMTLFACRSSDINKVLGSANPAISQPIILCLMQQLGTALKTTTDPNDLLMIVSWLQELALSLNTSDGKIKGHIPGVLQQIVTNVNAKAQAEQQLGTNPQLRRPLQMLMQVLRGMQMG
mmetsp:Transcript_55022/g.133666  ORF Transcript_55022/g.133666 Transcript_55022/m.133666 type:complete len:1180 (+) Transcript_55022:247-3786(+)